MFCVMICDGWVVVLLFFILRIYKVGIVENVYNFDELVSL